MRHESDRYRPIESLESEMRDRLAAKDAELARLKDQRDRLACRLHFELWDARKPMMADGTLAEYFRLRILDGKVEEIGNG